MKNQNKSCSCNGFTLIEVLVALSIVATALLAGSSASTALMGNAQRLSQVLLGQMCIENALVELRLQRTFLPLGKTNFSCEQAGKKFMGTFVVVNSANPAFRLVTTEIRGNATQSAGTGADNLNTTTAPIVSVKSLVYKHLPQ